MIRPRKDPHFRFSNRGDVKWRGVILFKEKAKKH